MQRHSGRDGVGVLRHTEELECTRTCVCVGQEETDSGSAECEEKGGVKKKKRHIHGGKPHLLPTCSAGIFRSEISSLHLGSSQNIGSRTLDFQQVAT